MTTHTITAPARTATAQPAAARGQIGRSWISALLRRLVETERRHRERRYLREMDDHLLQDIGLRREDINRAFGHDIDRRHHL
jgi:uncharacterized protein YjiS (DUF1127 family)